MGQNFSSRQDVYVNRFSNPKVQEHQKTFKLRGVIVPGETYLLFDGGKRFINPFSSIISQKDEEHSVIIIGIYVLYIDNETNHELRINVSNLFVGSRLNKDIPHTDDTGSLLIICPAGYSGPVTGTDRILYKPRLSDSVLQAYAGMEEVIIDTVAGPVVPAIDAPSAPLLLDNTHPLVYFIIQNMNHLKPSYGDFHENQKSKTFYVNPEFAQRAQLFFKSSIYEDLHKTRFNDTKVECQLPKNLYDDYCGRKNDAFVPNVTCIIQVNYLSILPGQAKVGVLEVRAE